MNFVSIYIYIYMSDQNCQMSDQKEGLKGLASCEYRKIISSTFAVP